MRPAIYTKRHRLLFVLSIRSDLLLLLLLLLLFYYFFFFFLVGGGGGATWPHLNKGPRFDAAYVESVVQP